VSKGTASLTFAAAVLCLAACESPRAAPPAPSALPVAAPTRPAEPLPPAPGPVEAPNTCRVLALTGKAEGRSGPLVLQASLNATGFVELAAGARVVAKHARSGRELTVEGPGRASFCPGGEEQVLLASGRFKSVTGPGARPGAEVWVATAAGVVRYGDATLSVRADGKTVEVAVDAGDAWLEAARGSTLKGSPRVAAKRKAALVRGADTKPAALVGACEKAAEDAEKAARQVLGLLPAGADAGTLGDRAAAQVALRRAARSSCASAGAALGEIQDLAERDRLAARIQRADGLWRRVPTP
jgi:hypothetical protein